MQIRDIAEIRTGVYLKPEEYKDIVYLQVKDFNERGEYLRTTKPGVFKDLSTKFLLLKDGDILFAAKGNKNFAAVFKGSDFPAVASSSFFVLSLTTDIIPEYVSWFVNHPKTQRQLKSQAMGSSIQSISIGTISALEILIPDKQIQKIIVELEKLRSQERKLNQELNLYREQLLDYKIFTKIMNEETN